MNQVRHVAWYLALALVAAGLASAQDNSSPGSTTTASGPATGTGTMAGSGNVGHFTAAGQSVTGKWVSFRFDAALGSVMDYSVKPAAPSNMQGSGNTGSTGTGNSGTGDAPTSGMGAGTGDASMMGQSWVKVFDAVDVEPWTDASSGAYQPSSSSTGTGASSAMRDGSGSQWVLRSDGGWLKVLDNPRAILHIAATQPMTLTLQPSSGITIGQGNSGASGANPVWWGVSGNGLDGKLLIVGNAILQGNAQDGPPSGATGTTAVSPLTFQLQRGGQVLFMARPAAIAANDFDAQVGAIQQQNIAGGLILSGEGASAMQQPLDLGVVVNLVSAAPGKVMVRTVDNRQAQGLCPASAAAPGSGSTGTTPPEGSTGTTQAACDRAYAIWLDIAGITNLQQNIVVKVDGQALNSVATPGAVYGNIGSGTSSGATGAPSGGTPQPGTGTTTTPGASGGSGNAGTNTAPGAGTSPTTGTTAVGSYNVASSVNDQSLVILVPPGDHDLEVSSTSATGTTPGSGTGAEGTQPRSNTPGFEAFALLGAAGAVAVLARRKK